MKSLVIVGGIARSVTTIVFFTCENNTIASEPRIEQGAAMTPIIVLTATHSRAPIMDTTIGQRKAADAKTEVQQAAKVYGELTIAADHQPHPQYMEYNSTMD